MIEVIISYDDNDSELGHYFEDSYNYLNNLFTNLNILKVVPIRGLDCSEEEVVIKVQSLENGSFIFVGLSHGNDSQLIAENGVYVDSNNIDHMANSLFYTPACNTAIELGERLIESNCTCFIGCVTETYVTYEEHHEVYMRCEHFCLEEFLSKEITIKEAFGGMMDYFDEQIDTLLTNDDDILVAMELQANKDSFVLLGNEELTKSNL